MNPNIVLLIGVLLNGCTPFSIEDYQLDDLNPKSKVELQRLQDTSQTLPLLAALPKKMRVDSLIYYAEWLVDNQEDVALYYAQQAYNLATEEHWNIPRGVAALRIARINARRGEYGENVQKALVEARTSKRMLNHFDHSVWPLDINIFMGFLFMRSGEQDSARHYLDLGLEQIEKLDLEKRKIDLRKANIYHNYASTFPLSDSLNFVSYLQKSDSLYQLHNQKEDQARLWRDWGILLQDHDDFDGADSLFNQCLNYGHEHGNFNIVTQALIEKGVLHIQKFKLYKDQDDFEKALLYLKEARSYNPDNTYRIYDLMGNLFQSSWAIDIDETHADSAIIYYKIAAVEARETGAIEVLKKLSANIVYLYDYQDGLHKDALGEKIGTFLNRNYAGVVDTLLENTQNAFERINEGEKRDLRISAEIKRRNQQLIGLGILVLLAITFLIVYQRQQNRRLRAEMAALRAQINPHFISNSLNAIENLVNLGKTKAASKYLVHFSRLSRQILTGSTNSITTLTHELKTLKHFLELEQLRFRDKLTYAIEIDPEVNTDLVQIPAMILQPYIENAIWHGIKPKKEGGHVKLEVSKAGKNLICIVEDNGIGREKSKALKKASVLQHKSMGMKITEDRIKGMGKIKGAHVEVLDLKNKQGEALGTRVVIRMPYRTERKT